MVLPAMEVAVTVSMFSLLLVCIACVVSSRHRRVENYDIDYASTQQTLLTHKADHNEGHKEGHKEGHQEDRAGGATVRDA